ncbi:hypothetical protein K502DRAFT_285085, partial [Neoconidiobolus thromboides FSU 785]
NSTMISSPHPISHIRFIKYKKNPFESLIEKELRQKKEYLQNYVHEFWCKNNQAYVNRKQEYEQEILKKKGKVENTDMTEFYKEFLQQSKHQHAEFHQTYIIKSFNIVLFSI